MGICPLEKARVRRRTRERVSEYSFLIIRSSLVVRATSGKAASLVPLAPNLHDDKFVDICIHTRKTIYLHSRNIWQVVTRCSRSTSNRGAYSQTIENPRF